VTKVLALRITPNPPRSYIIGAPPLPDTGHSCPPRHPTPFGCTISLPSCNSLSAHDGDGAFCTCLPIFCCCSDTPAVKFPSVSGDDSMYQKGVSFREQQTCDCSCRLQVLWKSLNGNFLSGINLLASGKNGLVIIPQPFISTDLNGLPRIS
jgi:hypothetical protein